MSFDCGTLLYLQEYKDYSIVKHYRLVLGAAEIEFFILSPWLKAEPIRIISKIKSHSKSSFVNGKYMLVHSL